MIRPSFQYISIMIAVSFIAISIAFAIGPIQDWKMSIASIVFATLGISLFFIIDYACLYIYYSGDKIKFKGYFGIRKFDLDKNEIEGYQIHQKVDQINGLHEEIQLVIKDRDKLILPRIAYSNYGEIRKFCQEFKFLGYKEIKYGKLLGKLIPLMFIISGTCSLLVALIQFFR